MVRIRTIIIAALVVIIGIGGVAYFSQSEEKKVKKRFDLMSEWVSKDPGEKAFTMAHKIQSLGTLFAETCGIKAPIHSLSGSYTPEEISGYAARARLQFSKLSLRFYDLDVDFPQVGIAEVLLTAKLTGRSRDGEHVDEIRELQCVLKKIEKKWLFSHIEVVEVLKK